jgi:ribosomal protein S3
VQGISIQLKGKINRRGSARKQKLIIQIGQFKCSPRAQHILCEYTQINTVAGTLGLNIALLY